MYARNSSGKFFYKIIYENVASKYPLKIHYKYLSCLFFFMGYVSVKRLGTADLKDIIISLIFFSPQSILIANNLLIFCSVFKNYNYVYLCKPKKYVPSFQLQLISLNLMHCTCLVRSLSTLFFRQAKNRKTMKRKEIKLVLNFIL